MRLDKGVSRTPKRNPNHEANKKKAAKRQLRVLQGGDPRALTKRVPSRLGSRLQQGEKRRPKKPRNIPKEADPHCESSNKEAINVAGNALVLDLKDYRQQSVAPQGPQEEQSQSAGEESSTDASHDQATEESGASDKAEEKPHFWTDADFTPEALASYNARIAAQQSDFAATRQRGKDIAAIFAEAERKKQALYNAASGGGTRQRRAAPKTPKKPSLVNPQEHAPESNEGPRKHESEACIHRMSFGKGQQQAAPPLPRPKFGSSHRAGGSPRKKNKK